MADPFVQRMMARTQARRNVLGKVSGNPDEKENISSTTFAIETNTSKEDFQKRNGQLSPLQIKNYASINIEKTSLYGQEADSQTSNELPLKTDTFVPSVPSPVIPSPDPVYSLKITDYDNMHVQTQTQGSSRTNRFQQLALRTKQMEQWEDDYSYHTGSSKEVESDRSVLHGNSSKASMKMSKHETKNSNLTVQSEVCICKEVSTPSSCVTKYHFGELRCPANNGNGNISPKISCYEPHGLKESTPQSSNTYQFHSAVSSHSKSSLTSNNDCKSVAHCNNLTDTPLTAQKHIAHANCNSPTKKLPWDKKLINSLEAQGFTPTESKSKLSFDFQRDRSPLKANHSSKAFEKNDQLARKSFEENPPPKIVSVCSKNQLHNSREKQNGSTSSLQDRNRDSSPSKVTNLRSRWEQHIRDASPERKPQSPSPTRKKKLHSASNLSRPMSTSPTRPMSTSPTRNYGSHSTSSIVKFDPCTNSTSPHNSQESSKKEVSDSNRFFHGCGFRRSLRSLSPHKPTPTGEIVKGEAPMPETTPIVTNPSASVKERAAAFASVAGKKTVKDPAEMSVQDRLNIFEHKKGPALIPKAPFGQCVSGKNLQSNFKSDQRKGSQSYEVPRTKGSVAKPNHTFLVPQQGPTRTNVADSKISGVEAHKKLFEHIHDPWRSSDINSKTVSERKNDMEVLLNRFKKPREQPSIGSILNKPEESDSEYPDSDESYIDSNVFDPTRSDHNSGPPKPPRVYEVTSSNGIPPPPPLPSMSASHSPPKRLNSTELDEIITPPSPTKEYVPRIKPGCLFPSLSDIDSNSETVDSQESEDDFNKDSSFVESVLTCASGESLGTHIQRMAQVSNVHPLTTINEANEAKRVNRNYIMSESTLEALEAIDDALDEALDEDDEPTPPKRGRTKDDDNSNSCYKTPKIYDESNSSEESEIPLAHSISMYRKQKPANIQYTPVRQSIRKSYFTSPRDSPVSPSVNITARIRELQEEEEVQLNVISQASSALNVVSQNLEQHGTMQHIEAEKLLLVATQKRLAAIHEIQRLKAEGALGKKSYWNEDEDSCQGSISINNIALPLKQNFISKSANDNSLYHLIVLVKHRDQVITSQLLTIPECIVEGAVTFPNLMSLHNLTADFNIALEVYCFRVESMQQTIKKEHSRMKLTPLKRLQKESKTSSPAVQSPGGPYSIRTSSFTLIGFAHLNINTLTRNAWTLEKVPFNSPLDGHLLMRVRVSMEGGVSGKGFLTMFEDVGGFGAWNRRWCTLSGPFLRYWNYPDDENKKECVGHLDLRMCTTRKVELVARDICARQFTFQLIVMRPARVGDKNDLVHEVKNNAVMRKILLSADSKEERILWCNKLNKALANIRAWDPDALKPDDFHV